MSSNSTELSLGEIFVANHAKLWRVARQIVRTSDLADDVMQDAYLRIADGSERKVDRPIGYCCQVVRNLALDYCRRQTLESTYRTFDVDVELVDLRAAPSPDRLMRERQVVHLIDKALAMLPARTRMVFELNRIEGYTQRAIALRLGCALGLVNRLIAEADEAIKACGHLLDDD
jgi:RNA polymerase sigma factor (sigma-70 family)